MPVRWPAGYERNCPECGYPRCSFCRMCHIMGCSRYTTTESVACLKAVEWGYLRSYPHSVNQDLGRLQLIALVGERRLMPNFLTLFHRHPRELHFVALARKSGLPAQTIKSAMTLWPISRKDADRLLECMNQLTGEHYRLEDLNVPLIPEETVAET